MKAGRMRCKIEVFAPVTSRDAYGATTTTYQSQGQWWAERVSISGRISDEASEHFPDATVRYNIRDRHHVEPNWQLTGDDGMRYTIVAVEPYKWLGMQTIVCNRVNP